jgi:hypothetical protein
VALRAAWTAEKKQKEEASAEADADAPKRVSTAKRKAKDLAGEFWF